jgi:hypothetical protein
MDFVCKVWRHTIDSLADFIFKVRRHTIDSDIAKDISCFNYATLTKLDVFNFYLLRQ